METVVVVVSDIVVVTLNQSALVVEAVVILYIVLIGHMLLVGVFEVHQPGTNCLEAVIVIISDVVVVALHEGSLMIETIVVFDVMLVRNVLLVGVCEVHQDNWLISQVVQVDEFEGLVSSNSV